MMKVKYQWEGFPQRKKKTFGWLIDWYLTPTLEVFQLYRGVEQKTTKRTRPNKNEEEEKHISNLDRVSDWFLLNAKGAFLTYIMSRANCFDEMMWMLMWMMMLHFFSATSLKKQFNYLCKQYLSLLKFESRSWRCVFSPDIPGSLTNKNWPPPYNHITEIL